MDYLAFIQGQSARTVRNRRPERNPHQSATKQLREMLLRQAEIDGLSCLENRKEVFEGVHRTAGAKAWAGWTFAGGVLPGAPAVTVAPKPNRVACRSGLLRRVLFE